MISKKKVVPASSRSRFQKAKPNLRVGIKSSQSSQLSEKKQEVISENNVSLQENKVEEFTNNTANEENVNTVQTEFSNNIAAKQINNILENTEPYLTDNSLVQEESAVTFSRKNELKTSAEKPTNCELEKLPESPVLSIAPSSASEKIVSENEFHNNVLNKIKETQANSIITESPQSSAILMSPVKAVSGNTTDKSSKYPCLTKILSVPKKKSQNKEIGERKKKMASYKELPSRSEMTFSDLIFWNPRTSPMKSNEKKSTVMFVPQVNKQCQEAEEDAEDDDDAENASVAPKLFVNENGDITIDESSLVIKRKKKVVDMTSEAIIMDDNVTFGSFRRKPSKQWSPKETLNFYKALVVVGTDFALMENIIPNRTRRELKSKFKKEEKSNMKLLHQAMYETETFQTDLCVEALNLDVIDIPGLEETILKDSVGPDGKKRSARKRKSEVLSKVANTDETDENSQALPLKKGRGRPKKSLTDSNNSFLADNLNVDVESTVHPNESLTQTNGQISPPKKSRGCPKKKNVESIADINSFLHNYNENEQAEQDHESLILRKRKVKVLSEDSLDNSDENDKELCEIQVQIYSAAEEEIPLSNKRETTTNAATTCQRTLNQKLAPKSRVKQNSDSIASDSETTPDPLNCSRVVIDVTDDALLSDGMTDVITTCESRRKQRIKTHIPFMDYESKNNQSSVRRLQPSSLNYTPFISEPDEPKFSGAKNKKVYGRSKPANPPITENPSCLLQTASSSPVNNSPFGSSVAPMSSNIVNSPSNSQQTEKSSMINSPSTTSMCPPSIYSHSNALQTEKSSKINSPSTTSMCPPSIYSPFNSLQTEKSWKISSPSTTSMCPPSIYSPSYSLQVPVMTPSRAAKLENGNSSPFVTSLNISSDQLISIPITPEPAGASELASVMLMSPSPSGKSLHFFVANNFQGGTPMPSQISMPPIDIVLKTEET